MVTKSRKPIVSAIAFMMAVAITVQVTAFSKESQVEEYARKPVTQFAADFEHLDPENIVAAVSAWVSNCSAETRPSFSSSDVCVDARYQTILEGLEKRKAKVECLKSLSNELEPILKLNMTKEEAYASLQVISLLLGGSSAGMWAYKSRFALRAAGKELLKKGGLAFEEDAGWLEFKDAMAGQMIDKSVRTSSKWRNAKKAFVEVSSNVEKATGKGMGWFYKAIFLLFVGDTIAGDLKANPWGSLQNIFGFVMPGDLMRSNLTTQDLENRSANTLQGLDHIDPELSLQDYKKLIEGREQETIKVNELFSKILKSDGNPENDPFYDFNVTAAKRASHIYGLVSTLRLMNVFEENVIYQWRTKVADRCQQMLQSLNQGVRIVKPAKKR